MTFSGHSDTFMYKHRQEDNLNLKIKEICELLNVSEKTVYRWIQLKKIPFYKINHQYRFNKAEINEWIIRNNLQVTESILEIKMTETPVEISNLIKLGGIYYDIEGNTIREVFKNFIQKMALPQEINPQKLFDTLVEREDLMPTTIGKGIAFPHPRSPMISDVRKESISVVFLKNPINYQSVDDEMLHTLFIIMSTNPKRHLEILSKLNFTCQEEVFQKMLENRAGKEELLNYIQLKESEWNKRMRGRND